MSISSLHVARQAAAFFEEQHRWPTADDLRLPDRLLRHAVNQTLLIALADGVFSLHREAVLLLYVDGHKYPRAFTATDPNWK